MKSEISPNTIKFTSSGKFESEKQFCIDFLSERTGFEIQYIRNEKYKDQYHFSIGDKKRVSFNDVFFSAMPDDISYIDNRNLPSSVSNLGSLPFFELRTPILYGDKSFERSDSGVHMGLDIMGSIFFMLSRWEEVALEKRDLHDRFTGKESLAYKSDFLLRPVVDEYCELLMKCFQSQGLVYSGLIKNSHAIRYTCDIDHIIDPASSSIFSFGGALVRSLWAPYAVSNIRARINNFYKRVNSFDCFDYIFDQLGKKSIPGSFFFITENLCDLDSSYNFLSDELAKLILRIYNAGYDIGLHPSYKSYKSADQIRREFYILKEKCTNLGITQQSWETRQHYLRWDPRSTMGYIEDAGLDYDTTLSYSDHIGFRTGTSHEHYLFDSIKRRQLTVRERPLIMMESTLVATRYMGLGYTKRAYSLIENLKDQCHRHGGTFNFLWHNSHLLLREDKEMFEFCLS